LGKEASRSLTWKRTAGELPGEDRGRRGLDVS
jgi:hypothetical protein